MSHNINSMMYHGERPWHGLGTEVKGVATAQEAIAAARLGWSVVKEEVYVKRGDLLFPIDNKRAITREDTGAVFNVMGDGYTPVQNVQAFGFFDSVVGEGQAIYHTAGALGAGERVWILAKLPKDVVIDGGDRVEQFLLLSNSHDGSAALRMNFTPVRVVCQNTLNIALGGMNKREGVYIRHTANALQAVAEARRVLGIAVKYYDQFEVVCNELAQRQIAEAALRDYYQTLVPDNVKAENKSRTENIRADLNTLYHSGAGAKLPGVRGTWWAAYNAVAEYTDHSRTTRGDSDFQRKSNRLESCWFGSGADLKQRAWDVALERVGVKLAAQD